MIGVISYAYIGYMLYAANAARSQASASRDLQSKLHSDGILAAADAQRRQFAQNMREVERNHELSVDMRAWPLVHSPAAVRMRLAQEVRRPLLTLFAPPPELKSAASAQGYARALKGFADTYLSGAAGGVLFLTGYWKAGCELDDAAVAALQHHLPEQPMALLSFAVLPGDCVEPRFAYLPGPGGNATSVRPLCETPIEVGRLMRAEEKELSQSRQRIVEALEAAGFSNADVRELLGQRISRNLLVERAERAIAAVGLDTANLAMVREFYSSGESSLAAAADALVDVLKVALLIAADGHNLLSRKLPPRLPELLPNLRKELPSAVADSLNSALEGYEALFGFPTLAGLPSVLIARERLLKARAGIEGSGYTATASVGRWATTLQLAPPSTIDDALSLLVRNARALDAGFVEWVGTILDEDGDSDRARRLYKLAGDLRARPISSSHMRTGELP